jgi:hypothetical protein
MRRFLALVLFPLCAVSAAAATVSSFTDRSDFLTAARGLVQMDDLAGIAEAGSANTLSQLRRGRVTYRPGSSSQLVAADRDAIGYDYGAPGVISAQLGFPSILDISLTGPIFGFGFDVSGFPLGDPLDLFVEVRTSGGNFTVDFASLGGSQLGFAGFVSDHRILSLRLMGNSADPTIANVTTATVPEPGMFVLTGAALGLLWIRRR